MEKEERTWKKKKSRQSIATHSKYNNNENNTIVFHKKWKNYNEIQLTKNKMDLNNRKMKMIIHPSPAVTPNHLQDNTPEWDLHMQMGSTNQCSKRDAIPGPL